MTTASEREQFAEPSGEQFAGTSVVQRQPFPYERYMAAQGVPVHEAAVVADVRSLELGAWERRGADGAFVVLDQLLDLTGVFVLSIAPGRATLPERHLYEERYLVVEGAGSIEILGPAGEVLERFDWRSGSLFAVPLNAPYRLVAASGARALLVSANTAPPVLNRYESLDFVFANDFSFSDRYVPSTGYFSENLELYPSPELGRAMWQTNVVADVAGCRLPLDNQRGPGYRYVELPEMGRGTAFTFLGEYPAGRPSLAHAHGPGAVLACVAGGGHTYVWPSALGPTPWADGRGDEVERLDYLAGGVLSPVPGPGEWYHQHFPRGPGPLRLLGLEGGLPGGPYQLFGGRAGNTRWMNAPLAEGGTTIAPGDEDPFVAGARGSPAGA